MTMRRRGLWQTVADLSCSNWKGTAASSGHWTVWWVACPAGSVLRILIASVFLCKAHIPRHRHRHPREDPRRHVRHARFSEVIPVASWMGKSPDTPISCWRGCRCQCRGMRAWRTTSNTVFWNMTHCRCHCCQIIYPIFSATISYFCLLFVPVWSQSDRLSVLLINGFYIE